MRAYHVRPVLSGTLEHQVYIWVYVPGATVTDTLTTVTAIEASATTVNTEPLVCQYNRNHISHPK